MSEGQPFLSLEELWEEFKFILIWPEFIHVLWLPPVRANCLMFSYDLQNPWGWAEQAWLMTSLCIGPVCVWGGILTVFLIRSEMVVVMCSELWVPLILPCFSRIFQMAARADRSWPIELYGFNAQEMTGNIHVRDSRSSHSLECPGFLPPELAAACEKLI